MALKIMKNRSIFGDFELSILYRVLLIYIQKIGRIEVLRCDFIKMAKKDFLIRHDNVIKCKKYFSRFL